MPILYIDWAKRAGVSTSDPDGIAEGIAVQSTLIESALPLQILAGSLRTPEQIPALPEGLQSMIPSPEVRSRCFAHDLTATKLARFEDLGWVS